MEEGGLPMRFIDQPIEVGYDRPPLLTRKPTCPDLFTWQEAEYRVADMLAEWVDFQRRGRMARNMQPAHSRTASLHGSWGVGRFFFRVRTDDGRVFDLYFDRAPRDAGDREGSWFLLGERKTN